MVSVGALCWRPVYCSLSTHTHTHTQKTSVHCAPVRKGLATRVRPSIVSFQTSCVRLLNIDHECNLPDHVCAHALSRNLFSLTRF